MIDVVPGPDGLGDFAEWNSLVSAAPGGSFFQSAQWCTSWWNTIASRPPMVVARLHRDNRLVASVAVALTTMPVIPRIGVHVPVVSLVGAGAGGGDHCGPVVRDGYEREAGDLWAFVGEWHPERTLLLQSIGPDVQGAVPAGAALVDEERCPRALIGAGQTFDDIRATWSRNRRRTLAKKQREFAAAGGRFEWVERTDELASAIEDVFRLHEARRARLGKPTNFGATSTNRDFHRSLIGYADEVSGSWVQLARVGPDVVGALYGFRMGSTYSVYQAGWDESYAHVSLGLLQYSEGFRAVVERGGRVFDMCRGTDAYKLRFATETVVDQSYARVRGMRGQLASVRWRARHRRRQGAVPAGSAADHTG